MLPLALDLGQDFTSFLAVSWPAIVLTAFLAVAVLYMVAYLKRFFEYLKAQESRYLGRRTLDLVRRIMLGIWIGLILVVVLVAFATSQESIKGVLRGIVLHLPSILVVVFSLTFSVVSAHVVARFLSYLRGRLEEKPETPLPPQAFVIGEMVAKYTLYILGLVVAVLGGLALLPPDDFTIRQFIDEAIFAPMAPLLQPSYLMGLVTIVILMWVTSRLADSVFTDFKRRTKKFTPRVADLFHSMTNYIIYGASVLAIIFLTLSGWLSADQLILFAMILVMLGLIASIILYQPITNALSGIALFNTDPFREGERVKVGDTLVCDVLEMNLTNTKVRTLRGEVVNLPNRDLLSKTIMNFNRSKPYAMEVDVTVSFDVPHWKVESLLTEAAKRTEGILGEPKPQVYATSVSGNTVSYQLWAYIREPKEMKRMKSELISKAQELFHEEGFKLLFLQV